MAATVRGVGTAAAANGGNLTPSLPAGWQEGDLCLVIVSAKSNDDFDGSGSGYARLDVTLPIESATNRYLDCWWKILGPSESNPTLTRTGGNSGVANCIVIEAGTFDDADPFGGVSTSSTGLTLPGITPDVADCLLLVGIFAADDTPDVTSYAMGGLTWTERFDDDTTLGTDSTVACATAPKADTIATGAGSFATGGTATTQAFTVAIRPAAGGATDFPLDSQPGDVAVDGAAASLIAARATDAQPGSVQVSGTDAALTAGYVLNAEPGAYAVAGTDAGFARTLVLSADPATYTLAGFAASPIAGRTINADPGAFTVTAPDAALPANRVLTADPASYLITGAAATPIADRILTALPGSYTLDGVNADLVQEQPGAYELLAEPGTYTISVAAAAVQAARLLHAEPGTLTLTGSAAAVLAGRAVLAEPGALTVTGLAATVRAARQLAALAAAYTIVGADATLAAITANIPNRIEAAHDASGPEARHDARGTLEASTAAAGALEA